MSETKQHQVYFEKTDYEQRTIRYKREGGSKLSQEELLVIAKGFFIQGEFVQCLNVLQRVNLRHSSKILFERQSLQFRADFLLKRNIIPHIDDMTKWREILQLVQIQSRNVKGSPMQTHHLQVIKHYLDFISLVEQRLTSKIVLDPEIFRQQKALQTKYKKYEGFPTYILSQMWIDDFNKAMGSRQQSYLSPINNFSIVNDIFQSYHYEDIYESYKNSVLFPNRNSVPVSKRYWNYLHSLMNEGKQFCPVKRLVNIPQTSFYESSKIKSNRTQPLIPIVVKCQQELIALQLTHNRRLEEQFYVQIQRKFGLGQFNTKNGQNWQIYDIEGPNQIFFQGFHQILQYSKVQLPKPIPLDQLRPLLRFDFAELPSQYLQDPQNGLKGLQNIGNSCYLNSCIQCLSNTQDLIKFAALNNSLKGINFDQKDGVVVTSFSELLKSIWNKKINHTYINPRKFKKAFGLNNTQFLEKTQEDAHQFLLCLLNCLHQELKQVNSRLLRSISKLQATTDQKRVVQYFQKHFLQQNRSIIMSIFQGKMHNTMKCGSCKIISHSYDVFLALTLPIPQQQSQFIDIYFCGWQAKQTKKYRMHINDMKNAQDVIQQLKKAVRKSEIQFYYVFGEINKQNLTFDQIALISLERINLLQEMTIQTLLEKAVKSHFIIYQMKKRNENQLLALIDYREDKNGLILGFPRLMHFQQKMIKESLQFKRDIAANERQNLIRSFDLQSLVFTKTKQDKNKPTSNIFDYIIQVIFKKSEKLFVGTDSIQDELNDPNTRYSVYDCFDLMKQPQILQGTWVCGNCRRTERVQKTQKIMETSNILVIHLKRFKADYRKIKTMIEYPVRGLQINRWIEKIPQGTSYKYDLYAVCLHTGTAQYGHYQAYCKHFVSQKWHQFDDGNVHEIQQQKVVSPHAYMLFYKRVAQI